MRGRKPVAGLHRLLDLGTFRHSILDLWPKIYAVNVLLVGHFSLYEIWAYHSAFYFCWPCARSSSLVALAGIVGRLAAESRRRIMPGVIIARGVLGDIEFDMPCGLLDQTRRTVRELRNRAY